MRYLTLLLPLALLPTLAPAAGDKGKDDGFVPMFNGKDLSGWVNVNCAPETFYTKDDLVITTGKPTGYLRTPKQYENFIAEFDWMHVPPTPKDVGNSGFFVWADPLPAVGTGYTRGIEVQVLVNLEKKDHYTSQGDLFSIWGAHCKPDRPHPQGWERCLPSENRCKGANEWNHYRVVANDGAIKLEVNGKEVSGVSECKPRKGYLGLESEGSECRFKNLKIKELPSTNPKADEICDVAQGHQQLFVGLDLRGWKAGDAHKKHWRPSDWRLLYDGKAKGDDAVLWTENTYADVEYIVDWRVPAKSKQDAVAGGILLRGSAKALVNIGGPMGSGALGDVATPREKADKKAGEWNRFRIQTRGDTVTIYLNGKLLVQGARVNGLPARGAFGLQGMGEAVEFGNLFVRELTKED
jgi:hypothetical protein